MGMSPEDKESIVSLVAAILHLGNISFVENGNYAAIANDDCKFCYRTLSTPLYVYTHCKESLKCHTQPEEAISLVKFMIFTNFVSLGVCDKWEGAMATNVCSYGTYGCLHQYSVTKP